MKNKIVFSLVVFLIISCNKKSKVEQEIETIPVNVQIDRFDKMMFESKEVDFPRIKQQFPYFFPKNVPDSVWTNKMKEPIIIELYEEVLKKYSDIKPLQKNIKSVYQHIRYYFPEAKTPKVVTLVSEMDFEKKVIYTDSLVLISLDLYLGKDHKFYDFPEYLKTSFESSQIMPDLVQSFAYNHITHFNRRELLSQMIYEGKVLYIKDLLLPEYSDSDKISYTEQQIAWCNENQIEMWKYFVEQKLLYDTSPSLVNRFISPAPFSKFYLEIDNESPGRVGVWIGWQIVRSFMKNNVISVHDMLQMDARQIFEKSKYKPKK